MKPAESEADFAEVFQRAPDVMAIVRVSDALMYEVNHAFEKVSGYRREQLVGRSSHDFPWWPSDEVRERVLGNLRAHGELSEEEVCFHTPDGDVIGVISGSPIIFRGERCVVWRANDVTQQRRMEREKQELEERLRKKRELERLGLMAGAIAHDFNNLLVGVLGNLELLLPTLSADSSSAATLHAIHTSAQRMAEHTRELLDYAGHTALKLTPLQLDALLAEVLVLARPLVEGRAELRLSAPQGRSVWVCGDPGQLTRLFTNLVNNAADALDAPAAIDVALSVHEREGSAQVRVRDPGRGMDENARARMFDPFFSTKVNGYGFGLASAPSIVERHRGTISVESAPGVGTTVLLSFPLHHEPAAPAKSDRAESSEVKRHRILIVDDDPRVRAVAHAMLSRLGFETVQAEDGLSAIERVRQDPGFALIMLDATMPGIDGAETLVRLRAIDERVPILLCSGYSQADFGPLLNGQPCTSFLTKPFRIEQLKSALASLLKA